MTTSHLTASKVARRIRPGTEVAGGFFRMCVLTGKALWQPFQWREFIWNGWFIMRVSFLPTIVVSIPLTVLLIFTLNVLLAQFGAADLSGAGAAIGAVTQLGPMTTVLVVAGAGSHRHLRRPRRAHHPRGNRRDGGARHRPDPPAGGAPRRRLDPRRHAAQRPGDHRRPGRRLPLRRLPAERLGRRLPRHADHDHRPARGGHRVHQGRDVRADRRSGRLLSRADRPRRLQGPGHRRQRDGGAVRRRAVRGQRRR